MLKTGVIPLPAQKRAMFFVFESLGSKINLPFGGATSIVSPTFKVLFAYAENVPSLTSFTATFNSPLLGDTQSE